MPHDETPTEAVSDRTVGELQPVDDAEDTVMESPELHTATELERVADASKTVLGLPEVASSLSLEPVRDNLQTQVALPPAPAAPRHRAHAVPVANVPTRQVAPARPTVVARAVVLGLAVVAVLVLTTWVVVGGSTPPQPAAPAPERVVAKPAPAPEPVAPDPKPAAPTPVAAPVPAGPPLVVLDAQADVVEPLAVHAPDVALNPAHKYRLTLRPTEARLGVVTARLEQRGEWGQLNEMASHFALQFTGVTSLRLHCTTGASFRDDSMIWLDLEDLAQRTKTPLAVKVAQHCLDASKFQRLELGATSYRVHALSAQTATLGDKAPLKVAWRVKKADQSWRAGTLTPGADVVVEGQFALFAVLDTYAADNTGQVKLELLSPEAVVGAPAREKGAVEFVPVK